ncbi:universal stress protein [Tsukamurella sp. NPDC003166]|uniref:universal stress protein n=1 Tax=Tsukamurella sp. NPDC003166 TaxID=3154444 RepID=UPI0033ACCFEB
MTIVAGFSASRHGAAPVELAAQIARTTGESIIAASVVERRLPPQADPLEDEYAQHLTVQAERALHGTVEGLPAGVGVTVDVRQARSVPDGLMALATEHSVSVVTVGSSSSSLLGRVALGGVTDRLVHAAAVPVAIAPRAYRPGPIPVRRLTVAYGGNADANGLLPAAAGLARAWGVRLRVVSFAARDVAAYSAMIDTAQAEKLVLRSWWERTRAAIDAQIEAVPGPALEDGVDLELGSGPDWRAAVESVEWRPGDLLLLGSGAAAPLQHVLLGSAAARILRASPVPVMILPRPPR